MPVTYNLPVQVNDEYYDEGPTHARITLDDALIARLYTLQKVVKDYKLYAVEDWDSTPEFLKGSEDDENDHEEWDDGRADCLTLKVTDDSFFWEFFIKNTSIQCSVDGISFDDLKEQLKENDRVMRATKKELPRLAVLVKPAKGALKYDSSKALVEKRLKGELK
jgi:hypothetical protein